MFLERSGRLIKSLLAGPTEFKLRSERRNHEGPMSNKLVFGSVAAEAHMKTLKMNESLREAPAASVLTFLPSLPACRLLAPGVSQRTLKASFGGLVFLLCPSPTAVRVSIPHWSSYIHQKHARELSRFSRDPEKELWCSGQSPRRLSSQGAKSMKSLDRILRICSETRLLSL